MTLLDASPNPGGLSSGWRTKQGRAVEAGVKGFWYQVSMLCMLCLSPPPAATAAASPAATAVAAAYQTCGYTRPNDGCCLNLLFVCNLQYANIFQLVKELDIEWCASLFAD